jgi:glycosyltransferase involved in cell wall biosynthesis
MTNKIKIIDKPMVSVVLPTFNRCGYLIQSIRSVLSQSYSNLEIIIVDDGSIDDTREVVDDIDDDRVIYIRNKKNLGIQKSLNKGIRSSKGKYIARIDDQDEWCSPKKLEEQVNYLENKPKCVLVGTGVTVYDNSGNKIYDHLHPTSDESIRKNILAKNVFTHSSVVFRKDTAIEVGLYSEDAEFRHIEDTELWLRLGQLGDFFNIPELYTRYVYDDGGISNSNKIEQMKKQISLVKMYGDYYQRPVWAKIRCYVRIIVYGYLRMSFLNKITSSTKKQ